MKVTGPQIRAAMKMACGNVSRAAEVLGIARNNLYKRLTALGIDPQEYRDNSVTPHGEAPAVTPGNSGEVTDRPTLSALRTRASVSSLPSSVRGRRARTFPFVNNATAAAEPPVIQKKLRQAKTIYLRPDQFRAVDDACFDLAAALREKFSPSKVFEQFFDDCWKGWLKEKLAPAKRRAGKKEE